MPIKPSILMQASRHDLPLINSWLVRPDMRRWWRNPMNNQCEMRLGIHCPDDIGRVYLIVDRISRLVGLISLIHAKAAVGQMVKSSPRKILGNRHINRLKEHGRKALVEAHTIVATVCDDLLFAWIEKDNAASLAVFNSFGYRQIRNPQIASYSCEFLRYDR
ncbi:MAG: hypothetical protein GY927_14635 [bacterium]|nr:hypothetical protein [bacterium]